MKITRFKAVSKTGEKIEASCVINKHGKLLLSNEDKIGVWIECDPNSLVCEINEDEEYLHLEKITPYTKDELKSIASYFNVNANGVEAIVKVAMYWTNYSSPLYDLYPNMETLIKASKSL